MRLPVDKCPLAGPRAARAESLGRRSETLPRPGRPYRAADPKTLRFFYCQHVVRFLEPDRSAFPPQLRASGAYSGGGLIYPADLAIGHRTAFTTSTNVVILATDERNK